MSHDFDPYHKWLGIPSKDQPPNHYRLLGLELFESDADVIDAAAFRQTGHVRTYQAGPYSDLSQRLLAEISAARVCLLNADTKAEYDASLRSAMAEPPVIAAPPPTSVAEPPVASLSVPAVSAGAAPGQESTYARARRRRATKSPAVELVKIVLGGIGGLVIAYCLLRFGFQIDILDKLFTRTSGLSATSPRLEGAGVTPSQPTPVDFTGTGADGPIAIRDRYEVDSIKTALTQSAASGATALSVAAPSDFHPQDEILIVQMRGVSAGQDEFHRVTSVGVDSLQLASALVNGYDASDSVSIQRVPNFTDVTVEAGGTLTASAWNGVTGGIVAFRASGVVHVKSGGSIHADHLGFRGGTATMNGSHADGRQGESPLGLGVQGNRYANGGGGGAGNYAFRGEGAAFADWGCGGGGGGCGSPGLNGIGTDGFGIGGVTHGTADLSRLMLGSGGASGGSDDDGAGTSSGGAGGAGGGIVFIAADSLVLSGSLRANGADGQDAVNKQGEDESGGGGGGSGGSVLVTLAMPATPDVVRPVVRGGTGGAGFCRGGDGGQGVTSIRDQAPP